jgi:flagellar motor switch protein FliN/FliY
MSELSTAGLATFIEVFQPLGEAFATSLSENINQLAVFDAPAITQESIGALITDPEPLVQTSFTFPALAEDEAAVLFSEQDALILADLIGLGDGTQPPQMLEEEHIERLSVAMNGFVQGIGAAIGNATERAVAPGPQCSTSLVPLTLSAGFLTAGYAVQLAYPYRVEGVLEGTLRLLITPNLARAVAGLPLEEADPDAELAGLGINPAELVDPPAPSFGGGASMPFQPFPTMSAPVDTMPRGMELIMDIPLDVSVELGRVQMLIKDVLELATGSIVELERVAGEPIDLMVNGQLIAKGEVVVIEDNFGIRITEIVSPADRLTSVGKRAA